MNTGLCQFKIFHKTNVQGNDVSISLIQFYDTNSKGPTGRDSFVQKNELSLIWPERRDSGRGLKNFNCTETIKEKVFDC